MTDPTANRLYLALQAVIHQPTAQLARDTALWDFLSYVIGHHAESRSPVSATPAVPAAIECARDYLHADYARDISLEALAAIAGLSRFHFCRMFGKTVGVSPSVYQTQLRIAQARRLLAQGFPIATVAAAATRSSPETEVRKHDVRVIGSPSESTAAVAVDERSGRGAHILAARSYRRDAART